MLQSQAATNELFRFLTQRADLREFAEWLISAVDDDSMTTADIDALEGLRLVLTEYGEDLRSLDELKGAAAALVLAGNVATVASSSNEAPQELSIAPLVPTGEFTFTELCPT